MVSQIAIRCDHITPSESPFDVLYDKDGLMQALDLMMNQAWNALLVSCFYISAQARFFYSLEGAMRLKNKSTRNKSSNGSPVYQFMLNDNLSTGRDAPSVNRSCDEISAYHHSSNIDSCSGDSFLDDIIINSSRNESHSTFSKAQHESGQLRDVEDLAF